MKMIIDGIEYDTGRDEVLTCCNNGFPRRVFAYAEEYLYRRNLQEYYLYICRGSIDEQKYGSPWYTEHIVPMTVEQAKDYVNGRFATTDAYADIF